MLKAAGADPKTFFPLATGRDRLQVLIDARVRQVKSVRDGGHWFETNEFTAWRRIDHRNRIFGPIAYSDPLFAAFNPKFGFSVWTPHKIRESIVELHAG